MYTFIFIILVIILYFLIRVHLTLCRHCHINRFMMQQNHGCSQD